MAAAALMASAVLFSACEKKTVYPSLSVDPASAVVEVGGANAIVNVLSGSGSYSVSGYDNAIVAVELGGTNEDEIEIAPVAAGETKIVVTDDLSGETLNVPVTVLGAAKITFHHVSKYALPLTIDAAEADREKVWIDLDGDGIKGEGEDVAFGEKGSYTSGPDGYVTVYGPVTVFDSDYGCSIDEIDLSCARYLVTLNLQINKLEEIDLSQCSRLEDLNVSNNSNLLSVDLSNMPRLKKLSLSATGVETLDLSNCPELEDVACINTPVKSMEFGDISKVKKLNIWNNVELKSIDISGLKELTFLNVSQNGMTSLDVSANTALETLSMGGSDYGRYTSLDLTTNTNLVELYVGRNAFPDAGFLKTLPNPEKLKALNLEANSFSKVDLNGFSGLRSINVYTNKIKLEDMKALVEALPTLTAEDAGKIVIVDRSFMADQEEGNEIDDEILSTLTGKFWRAYDSNTGAGNIPLNNF